ncbi:amidase [Paracoccus sp. YIM 132242]|uniref:Amidase n=1 Tax=Paracoccus lichenicola TaxID=2665644 RepID=A0A6L6HQM6_9RHOB|nr:amidase [Paracoccus lichenicola]MTE01476.1 amidase [Paracoccus lichenicola]
MNTHAPILAAASDIADLSLTQVSRLIATGAATPAEVTEAVLTRIARLDPHLNSYQVVLADRAREKAAQATAERQAGLDRGPMHGVPIALKDLCETAFAPTAAGMAMLRGNATGRDATVTARLEQAGAIVLGKLAMTEGAYAGHHPDMPVPKNPWNGRLWAGSSSSGSGVAVAAGLCFGALGSDTGGSIRFPSGANGITGMKPTWGRVSRHGVFALADSLDHIGPMARTAADCAAMLGVIAGADPNDPTALTAPVPDYLAGIGAPIHGLRIGVDASVLEGTSAETAAMLADAVAALTSLGAVIVPVALPFLPDVTEHWTALCGIEVALAHKATYPDRAGEYGPSLGGLLQLGHALTADQVGRAMQWRLVFNGMVERAMSAVDMVLLPVLGAPLAMLDNAIGAPSADPANADLGDLLKFTAPADLTGYPALTLPGGFDARGGPMGLQLMGKPLSEALLFRAGHAFQSVTDWHTRRPMPEA